jgi:chromosome segregation ATPase
VLQVEIALLKATVERLDGSPEQERSERTDLREQALEFKNRLGDLEKRVQEIKSRLPPD